MFKKFEKLKTDPEYTIHSRISQLKAEIDLRREKLKNQIDEDALEFIKKLDDYEKDCKANIVSIKADIESNEKLAEWKEDLNRWREQMNTFERNVKLWKKINEEAGLKYDKMVSAYNNLYDTAFLSRLRDYLNLKLFIGSDIDMIK